MKDEQLKNIFKKASEIASEVPEVMQPAAFNRALDFLLSDSPIKDQLIELGTKYAGQSLEKKTELIRKKDSPVELGEAKEDQLLKLVNTVKTCEEAELIGVNILDRNSQVDRILLPMYISHKYFSDKIVLTTGDISKFLSALGINISTANVSHIFSSAASKYIIGDKIQKKGQPIRYRLTRSGVKYLSTVIQGKAND